jgi:hypothetical protein
MTGSRVALASLSAAMDGGFTAVADVSAAMATSGTTDQHRLIGGVAVMLHVERLGLDLPLRATGDADFGVPPYVLREPDLIDAIEALGYRKVAGNRWERRIDDRRFAAVDLLTPTYRSRARDTVTVGSVVTSEIPGLAQALQRPPVTVDIELLLTDGETSGGLDRSTIPLLFAIRVYSNPEGASGCPDPGPALMRCEPSPSRISSSRSTPLAYGSSGRASGP